MTEIFNKWINLLQKTHHHRSLITLKKDNEILI